MVYRLRFCGVLWVRGRVGSTDVPGLGAGCWKPCLVAVPCKIHVVVLQRYAEILPWKRPFLTFWGLFFCILRVWGTFCGACRRGIMKFFSMVIHWFTTCLCYLIIFFEKIFWWFWKWLYLCIRFRPKNGCWKKRATVVWNGWEERDSVCRHTYKDMCETRRRVNKGKRETANCKL